jgi:hypothetical protein
MPCRPSPSRTSPVALAEEVVADLVELPLVAVPVAVELNALVHGRAVLRLSVVVIADELLHGAER